MKTYIFELKHDKGTQKIRTVASSLEAARAKIMNFEGCPANALRLL